MNSLKDIQRMNSEIEATKAQKLARLTNGVEGDHPKDREKGRRVKESLNRCAKAHYDSQPKAVMLGALGATIH